jgi:hypothetical protein
VRRDSGLHNAPMELKHPVMRIERCPPTGETPVSYDSGAFPAGTNRISRLLTNAELLPFSEEDNPKSWKLFLPSNR